jgi:hypothetical protein
LKRKRVLTLALIAIILIETALLVYHIPAVNERLAWRVLEVQAGVRNYFFPHPDSLATPDPGTLEPDLPSVTPTETAARPPVPEQLTLAFDLWVKQNWNNCAAANLTMMLNFWGWGGNQVDAGSVLKPYWDDKNVMPYELERYVLDYTGRHTAADRGGFPGDDREGIRRCRPQSGLDGSLPFRHRIR